MREPIQKEASAPVEVEVISSNDKTGLVSRDEAAQEMALFTGSQAGMIERLMGLDNAAVIFERHASLLESCRRLAIRNTNPEDWVLSKPSGTPDEEAIAMLCSSGAQKVKQYYGIDITNVRPTTDGDKGVFAPDVIKAAAGPGYTMRAWCDARSKVTGLSIEGIEASRTSTEQFVGRNNVGDSDMRAAVYTLLNTKAVRSLTGMGRVPVSELIAAWDGTAKSWRRCRLGSGFGKSLDRKDEQAGKAQQAAGNTAPGAEALWNDILKRVGGDETAGKKLLQELTAFTGKDGKVFTGYLDWRRMSEKMIGKAGHDLKRHPVFGDDAAAAPASTVEDDVDGMFPDREPGED